MSKWEQYKVISKANPSRWQQYKVAKKDEDSWLPLIGKSVAKGVAGLGDLARGAVTAFQDPNMMDQDTIYNKVDSTPELPTFTKEGLNYLDLQPNPGKNSLKKIAGHAAEWAAPGGIIGKFGKGARALKEAAIAGGLGATSGVLQEGGVNQIAADIIPAIAAPFAPGALKSLQSLSTKAIGLSPKKLNLPVARAAKDLNIELPTAALTEGKAVALADQFVSKSPFFGDKLKKKYNNVEGQVKKTLDEIYDATGPLETEEIRDQINKLYSKRAPEDAQLIPSQTLRTIEEIEQNFKTLAPSEDEVKLFSKLNELKEGLKPAGIKNIPAAVNALVDTKKSLNATIKWNKDQGVKNLLRRVQKSLVDDIDEYGKINKEWHHDFKAADELYGKVAKRERLEELLSGKAINPSTDTLSYNNLSKAINDKTKAKELKRLTSPEIFTKIEKLGKVSKAFAIKNQNVPNPSGTAATSFVIGYIANIFGGGIETAATLVGAKGLTDLLTNQKFLDAAITAAENPTLAKNFKLNKIFKDITGNSVIALSKQTDF